MLALNIPRNSYSQLVSFKHLNSRTGVASGIFCRLKTSYIVLLPEVPEDSAATNPLLTYSEIPNFHEIDADKCYSAVGKQCLDYETSVWALEEKLKDGSVEKTFDSVIGYLDKMDARLTYAWSTVKTFYSVRNDLLSTSNYLKIHERARKARIYKYQSKPIYNACKEIYVTSNTDEVQKRVIRKFLLESRLNGIELSHKDHEVLASTVKKLEEHKYLYRRNLKESSMRFSYRIMDPEIVKEFPQKLLKRMAFNSVEPGKGPWTVTHHPEIYKSFLEYCPDKDLRWNAWNAFVMRNSSHVFKELDNGIHVEHIREARNRQANILGFKTFADMSMETKMAGSVDNVLALIASLFDKAKEKQEEELQILKEFAQKEGLTGDLDEFDVPYFRRKHLQTLTSMLGEVKLEEYFPFNNVWEQFLSLCSSLFGVHFEEVPTTSSSSSGSEVKVWDEQVRFYNILDSDGKKISAFYLDAFRRPNQKIEAQPQNAWMISLKTRCDAVNYLPVASLIFNFDLPPPEKKGEETLLTFEDVQMLFKKFGHALQHLLSTVPYSQVSGLTNVEWDAVEVCSNFMLQWLYEPSVLEKLTRHYRTGESLPPECIKSILQRRSHMAGYDLCNELFLSHLDIKLHTENNYWVDILKELWPLYKPFKLDKHNSLPCWFNPIMSDVWAAAYYSHTWSQMVAADAFRAFKESEPQEITTLGRRFKETFLCLGGGSHPGEVFRQFRGRDPTPDALQKVLDIS